MIFHVVENFSEDQRKSLATIKIRRGRIARVLRGALQARRAYKQTHDQMQNAAVGVHRAGRKAMRGQGGTIDKPLARLQTMTQRYHAMGKKYAKRLKAAGRPSKLGPYRRGFRAALDTAERPANPKTYGRGEKYGKGNLRKPPKKIWRDAP